MTLKRRRAAAPYFKVPPVFNAMTGEHAALPGQVDPTRCAMMQVIEEDTHDNYLVCRGYDPECETLFETINVAKPYGIRGTYPCLVGQVFAAVKPKTALGETSGKAATTVGHPADLSEAVTILIDDAGNPISWLMILSEGSVLEPFELKKSISPDIAAEIDNAYPLQLDVGGGICRDYTNEEGTITVCDILHNKRAKGKVDTPGGEFGADHGAWGYYATLFGNVNQIIEIQQVARMFRARLTADLVVSDATATVDHIRPMDDGQLPMTVGDDADVLTVTNPRNPQGDGGYAGYGPVVSPATEGTECVCALDSDPDNPAVTYRIVDMACPHVAE